ncbi:MAG: hypothetical protein QM296_04290 [Bacillota bacterium]|nr:hypothetical protein [Bacillota bacterium]
MTGRLLAAGWVDGGRATGSGWWRATGSGCPHGQLRLRHVQRVKIAQKTS